MSREDRISQLTEHLRHCILSHLPPEDAIKTTLLSKSWKDNWLSLPCIEFNQTIFNKITQNNPFNHVTEYLDFVHQVLIMRHKSDNITLQTLKLFIPDQARDKTSRVNQLLHWVVNEIHVEELSFSFGKQLRGCYLYELPVAILASGHSEITKLDLQNCLFDSPVETQWSKLKSLSLTRVMLNQEILDSITAKANCPNIEELCFYQCHGQFDTLNASTLKRLVSVTIFMDMKFKKAEIDAPTLRSFLYGADYSPFQTSSGSGFQVSDLGTISNRLEDLTFIYNAGLTDDWLNRNLDHFSNLRSLSLCRCHNVTELRISSTTLTSLMVNGCRGLEKAVIETPRLKFLRFSQWGLEVPSVKLSALSLKKAVVSLLTSYPSDNIWHVGFIRFLSNFKDCQEFEFEDSVVVSKYAMIPADIKECFRPPLYGVKHVVIKIDISFSHGFGHDLAKLLDTLLWFAPRPETISTEWIEGVHMVENKLLKFKYMENNTTTIECDRCLSLPVRCWQHCLVELTIEDKKVDVPSHITRVKHDTQLRDFFENITTDFGKIIVNFINA